MTNTAAWRTLNVISAILAFIVLFLQIVAVASGSWKTQYVILSRFQPLLGNVYMYRKIGLFRSVIEVSNYDDQNGDNPYVVTTGNRYPMVAQEALMHCTNGPSLRYQLTVCDQYHRSHDCYCGFFDHWISLIVLELISLPLAALLLICCMLLRTYPQRFLKSATLLLCILTGAVILAGFVMVFQFWDLESDLFSNILPYYVRMIMIQMGMKVDPLPPDGIPPYNEFYTADNVHLCASWSAYVSLGALLGTVILVFLLTISWMMDIKSNTRKRKVILPEGGVGTYKMINN